jgi:IclR family transcriptional regulator, pca regulon regulatory protein
LTSANDRNFINSFARGLQLIMTFTKERSKLSLTEVARANEMNLPTARRYLHTLVQMGFIIKDKETQAFQLTPKVLRLGSWMLEAMGIRERLLPYMSAITKEWDITTHCAILEGVEIVTVERLRSTDVVNLDLTAGSRLPAYATSLGKAILAFLPLDEQKALVTRIGLKPLTPFTITGQKELLKELDGIRTRFYAVADQELTIGLKTMAVPIFDKKGTVEASFGVSYPVFRARENGLEDTLKEKLIEVMNHASPVINPNIA